MQEVKRLVESAEGSLGWGGVADGLARGMSGRREGRSRLTLKSGSHSWMGDGVINISNPRRQGHEHVKDIFTTVNVLLELEDKLES